MRVLLLHRPWLLCYSSCHTAELFMCLCALLVSTCYHILITFYSLCLAQVLAHGRCTIINEKKNLSFGWCFMKKFHMHLINWCYHLMSRCYHHSPFNGRFLTTESKVLIRISQSGPWLSHWSLLLPIFLSPNNYSAPPNMLLPQGLCTYPWGLDHSDVTWLAPSLPSGLLYLVNVPT